MQRGKNDAVDARRIAEYAYRFRDQMRLWEPPRQIIQQLSFLSAVRQRLIQAHNLLAGPLAEQKSFVGATLQKKLQATSKKSLTALKDEQKAIDAQIDTLIQGDSRLKELFNLIVSVPGVGAATATEILVATNELKTINDPKKMAASAVRLSCRRCPF
jgi:transposase